MLKASENYDTSDFDTLVFNDCSVTLAEAIGSAYTIKCSIYTIMALLPTLLSCWFLRTMILNKQKKNKGKGKKSKFNMSEKMCVLNIVVGVMHSLCLMDIDSFSGFMHIEYYRPIFLGICGGSMYHIQVMLVTNWIGLIDSAMSKTKPAW